MPPPPTKLERIDRIKLEPFPVHCLPDWVRDMVLTTCDARNVPPEIAGPIALGALSASLGRKLFGKNVMGDGLLPANTFILIGADTSQGKSRGTEPLMQPILDFEETLEKEWEHKRVQLQDEKETLQNKLKRLEVEDGKATKGTEPKPTTLKRKEDPQVIKRHIREIDAELARGCRRLICEKTTVAYFRDALAANDCVMTFFSDDARAFIQSVLKSEENITLLLKGFSLGNYVMGKWKKETRLKKIWLNLLLLCQPDFVAELFSKGAVSGLLGRFFVCNYVGDLTSRDPNAPRMNPTVQQQYHERLTAMVRGIRMVEQPLFVSGTSETNHILWAYGDDNTKLANQSAVRINELVPRREEKAGRLALNLHAALRGPEADEHDLTPETVTQAIEITRWFAAHENVLFAENHARVVRPVPDRIVNQLKGQDWTKERDIYRNLKLAKPEITPYFDQLLNERIIERRVLKTEGGASVEYRLVTR